ncbi:prolyl-tRNA synthetase associated domain-containing protein [Candidatus Peregrinibacteria bacterium]|nr:prolyl-tRNA synthetase associated domain-containing protein [Candidatus Peregrinibacteria bacterium]
MKYKETSDGKMIIHCMCCENAADPEIRARIEEMQKACNTKLVSSSICPDCEIAQNEKIDPSYRFSREKIENYLRNNDIEFMVYEHPAVYTCAEVAKLRPDIPGLACKNLLLKDKSNDKCYLVIIPADEKVNFKKFAKIAGAKKLIFADEAALKEKLGLEAGAVSPFGLLNDTAGEVALIIHKRVLEAEIVSFHPNVNTATLALEQKMFQKFLGIIKRPALVTD